MTEELYINGNLIELKGNPVSQTLQINDIANVEDRNANYTGNIIIPRTPRNVSNLEMLATVGNKSQIPYSSVSVKYIVNGIELISEGKGLLKNANENYNLVVYDGNVVLKELVGSSTLAELDFSLYNHSLTQNLFLTSWSNTEGYIYPLGAYYELDSLANNSSFPIDVSTPMLFLHTLFDMIFSQRGYTLKGDIFTDAEFLSRVVSMNNGYLRDITTTSNSVYFRSTALDAPINESVDYTAAPIEKSYSKGSYIVTMSGAHKVNLIGSVSVVFGTNYKLVVTRNGGTVFSYPFVSGQQFNENVNINANAGDVIEILIKITEQEYAEFNKIQFSTAFNINIYKESSSIPIDFSLLIGDTSQISFLKSIMQHYGLIFRKTRNEDEFEFIKIKDILVDRAGSEDWSRKLISVDNEDYKPPFARNNIAKYLYDDANGSTTEQTYADGNLLLTNDRLDESKTLFSTIFKAGVLDNNYYRHKHWINNDGVIEINNDGLRLYRISKVTDSIRYRFRFESSGWSDFSGVVAKLYFADYQEDLNDNYLEFRELLQEYKETDLTLNLSVLDIYELDFFKLKYFEQLGAYYYLNKVSSFKNGRPTKAQLMKIGAGVYEGLSIGSGTYAGSSVYAGTISKNTTGDMIGGFNGSSSYAGRLTKNDVLKVYLSIASYNFSEDACADNSLQVQHHNGGTVGSVDVGDTVFTDVAGTIPKDGLNKFWKMEGTHTIKINNNGVVISKIACI